MWAKCKCLRYNKLLAVLYHFCPPYYDVTFIYKLICFEPENNFLQLNSRKQCVHDIINL